MARPQKATQSRFGELLIKVGKVTPEQLNEGLELQKKEGMRVG